ncbi:MAG: copper homeostasis protein CutC [Isosphaeraceae bacterium]|nr:copper homeostasis protein CutC [Isosphaeraceae bacterium]
MKPFPSARGRRILLEVCVAGIDDAIAARDGGADRLELNSALALGGLTPSLGAMVEVSRAVDLPVLPMLRPRPGGFRYSEREHSVIEADAEALLEAGAAGLVFGFLRDDGEIDVERCRRLRERIPGERAAVFHRAFDVVPDPFEALEILVDLGFRRILTSGQAATALVGAGRLRALIERARGRIEILPAAGIRPETIEALLEVVDCDQVHGSLRSIRFDRSTALRPEIRFGDESLPPEDRFDATDRDRVAALRERLDRAELGVEAEIPRQPPEIVQ